MSWGPLNSQTTLNASGRAAVGLKGIKLCGNPNVPAGHVSFQAWGELLSPEGVASLSPRTCSCLAPCACIQPEETSSGEIKIIGGMEARVQTAKRGFSSPEVNSGKIVFYRPASKRAVPTELSEIGRAADDEAVHILLLWDGAQPKRAIRLSPFVLHSQQVQGEMRSRSSSHVTDCSWTSGSCVPIVPWRRATRV